MKYRCAVLIITILSCLAVIMVIPMEDLKEAMHSCRVTKTFQAPPMKHGVKVVKEHKRSEIYERRKAILRKGCNRLNVKSDQHGQVLYLDKYKLLYCPVAKVAVTNWYKVWLVLSGIADSTNNITANDTRAAKNLKAYRYLEKLTIKEQQKRLDGYLKFLFVRHPFERLLSVYRKGVEIPGEKSPMYEAIADFLKKRDSKRREVKHVKFEEYVQYLVDKASSKEVFSDKNLIPIHKLCSICHVGYDIIGKLEDMKQDAHYILQQAGVDGKVVFPANDEDATKSSDTGSLRRYYSKVSPENILKLYRIYQFDFKLLDYPFPDSYLRWSDIAGN
ncbi:carbohydrate sulfotransferase 11-like [Ptychodera flava]|uniref:carbohydrate sulfotransferase 11-like n=1 Tax=Ptychodera flava TaxID=63121 RepID=UPI00396A0B36